MRKSYRLTTAPGRIAGLVAFSGDFWSLCAKKFPLNGFGGGTRSALTRNPPLNGAVRAQARRVALPATFSGLCADKSRANDAARATLTRRHPRRPCQRFSPPRRITFKASPLPAATTASTSGGASAVAYLAKQLSHAPAQATLPL